MEGCGRLKSPYRSCARGWALVRVCVAGICNTDVEILRGYHDFRGTPGHEFVGQVAEVKGVSAGGGEIWVGRGGCGAENVPGWADGVKAVWQVCRGGLRTH